MGLYPADRAWSDRFVPAIKQIVGPYLLEPAPLDVDRREATDLIVLRARNMRIAARIRREDIARDYPFEFTIRSHRENGVTTELDKIFNGFGDWLFYGHARHNDKTDICLWWLIDLHAFRAAMIRDRRTCRIRYGEKSNGDGTSFYWFDLFSFPEYPPILIASSQPLAARQFALDFSSDQRGYECAR